MEKSQKDKSNNGKRNRRGRRNVELGTEIIDLMNASKLPRALNSNRAKAVYLIEIGLEVYKTM